MIGDNHVTPAALFDPEVDAPPADAFDIQFRVPLSLAAYIDTLATNDHRHELADVQAFYERLIDERIVRRIQEICGRVDEERDAARLAITPVIEPSIPGVAGLRPHAHVYVGGTAERLSDGQRRPVDESWLRQGVFGAVWPDYCDPIDGELSDRHGLTWERVAGGVHEIVDPPLAEQATGMRPAVCPGPWGPRRLVLADESYLAGCAESEAILAHQRAIGMPGVGT